MPAGEEVLDSNNLEIETVLVAMSSFCIATAKQVHRKGGIKGKLVMHGLLSALSGIKCQSG
jgi:hypothetical protein